MLDKNKICFITCVTSEMYYEEVLLYLRQLRIPGNMSVEYISIRNAKSMTSGYNKAMKQSNAKYKIYLHQDFFLTNKEAINELMELFQSDVSIGMIGLAGCVRLPASGIWWKAEKCLGMLYHSYVPESICQTIYGQIDNVYSVVQAIDGVFMATQYDLIWREDMFLGWHFYDISQSIEFYRAGYKVVLPKQEKCWGIHATGEKELGIDYRQWRNKFLEEYGLEIL